MKTLFFFIRLLCRRVSLRQLRLSMNGERRSVFVCYRRAIVTGNQSEIAFFSDLTLGPGHPK